MTSARQSRAIHPHHIIQDRMKPAIDSSASSEHGYKMWGARESADLVSVFNNASSVDEGNRVVRGAQGCRGMGLGVRGVGGVGGEGGGFGRWGLSKRP